jgi:hypothetical protein
MPNGGASATAPAVTMSSVLPGAQIRYTLNGMAPTATAGTAYTQPVMLMGSAIVQAIAVSGDGTARISVFHAAPFVVGNAPLPDGGATPATDGGHDAAMAGADAGAASQDAAARTTDAPAGMTPPGSSPPTGTPPASADAGTRPVTPPSGAGGGTGGDGTAGSGGSGTTAKKGGGGGCDVARSAGATPAAWLLLFGLVLVRAASRRAARARHR